MINTQKTFTKIILSHTLSLFSSVDILEDFHINIFTYMYL